MPRFEEIVKSIVEKTGIDEQEVMELIAKKQEELSNLVSQEGAAYIVARDLGLNLIERPKRNIEIKSIVPGIKSLNLTARIININNPLRFERDGVERFVQNVVLADKTGRIVMTLWNEQREMLNNVKVGDVIEVRGAYTIQNNRGFTELRLGRYSVIEKIEQSDLYSVQIKTPRLYLKDIKENEQAEVRAAIVQIFDIEPFFDVCSICKNRIKVMDGSDRCQIHPDAKVEKSVVVAGIIDDGTANMRAVFFRKSALMLAGLNSIEDALAKGNEFINTVESYSLGREFIMSGIMRKNKVFERMEFVVNNIREADPREEVSKIINTFGLK